MSRNQDFTFEQRALEIKSRRQAAMVALETSGSTWSKEDILNGLWDLYLEHCEMQSKREGVSSTRYPDLEVALAQIEKLGLAS